MADRRPPSGADSVHSIDSSGYAVPATTEVLGTGAEGGDEQEYAEVGCLLLICTVLPQHLRVSSHL
jgi:hypothetical protein